MNKINKNRFAVLCSCILFVSTLFLSYTFMIKHSDHHCDGHHCETCTQINAVKNLIRQFSLVFTNKVYTFGVFVICISLFKSITLFIDFITLVKLKVRLDN